jgi:mono/diheme cytochrome c family protein
LKEGFVARVPGKVIGIAVGIIAILLVAIGSIYFVVDSKLNQTYMIPVEGFEIPSDPESIARGEHLVKVLAGCEDCHGADLGGMQFFDDPLSGRIASKNLTSGKGGIGSIYSDADWVRAIRHGVGSDSKPLVEIPSNIYYNISDADLAAMIAYLKSIPPVDNQLPPDSVGPLTRVFILLEPSLLPAQVIDHQAPRPPSPAPEVSLEYGSYLAVACTVCHGENLSGGLGAGSGLNLTSGGDLANWTEEDFIETLRTGYTPSGKLLDGELMPWGRIGQLSDDEIKAIWLYLKSIPSVESASN